MNAENLRELTESYSLIDCYGMGCEMKVSQIADTFTPRKGMGGILSISVSEEKAVRIRIQEKQKNASSMTAFLGNNDITN